MSAFCILLPKWISEDLEMQQDASKDAPPAKIEASKSIRSSSQKPEDKTNKDKKPTAASNKQQDEKKGGSNAN